MPAEILKIPCSNKGCMKIHDVKWDNGVWPSEHFILVADWIYCNECWDEIEKNLYSFDTSEPNEVNDFWAEGKQLPGVTE